MERLGDHRQGRNVHGRAQRAEDRRAAQDDKFASGRIALQHGQGVKDDKGVVNDKGVVKFRKVEIKAL